MSKPSTCKACGELVKDVDVGGRCIACGRVVHWYCEASCEHVREDGRTFYEGMVPIVRAKSLLPDAGMNAPTLPRFRRTM